MNKLFPGYENVSCAYCSHMSILSPGMWISSCSECDACLPLLRKLPSKFKYILLQCNDSTTYVPVPSDKSVYDCPLCEKSHKIYIHCSFYINRRKVDQTDSENRNVKESDFSVNSTAQRALISFFALEMKAAEREESLKEELEMVKKENEGLKRNLETSLEENKKIKKELEIEEKENNELEKDLKVELEKNKRLGDELERKTEATNVNMKELEQLASKMEAIEMEKIHLEKVVKEKDELIKFFQEEHKKLSSAIVFQMAYGIGGKSEQKMGAMDEQTDEQTV